MIQRHYRLDQRYRVAFYARMSDKSQNQRSPEQQVATVKEVMRRCNCPWTVVDMYFDRALKGRYLKRRAGLQRLLRDIATGRIKIDLIVVDTYERFGRADEFEEIRRRLRVEYGVMIVAADSGFADPTGMVGKAVGMIEQIRSTEDGRIKAHQVVRGKKDAVRQKRWPGGRVPFGYKLKKCVDNSGTEPLLYSVLEVDPETAPILQRIFQKAFETAWGATRLAKFFNADASIPDKYKPFYAPTITWWLKNEVYIGIGVWGELCTDIINDARVIETNPHPDEVVRVEGFCEPLVSREVFFAIRAVFEARARPKCKAAAEGGEKLIRPLSAGLSIRHPLAGLVHCGECNACSVPRTSGRKSKSGQEYCYYNCPRHNDGACTNANHVRVDYLWPAVVSRLRKRLLPSQPGVVPDWFPDIVRRVEGQVQRLTEDRPRHGEQVRQQIQQLEGQMSGWRQSLGNPLLAASFRQDLERDYEAAMLRRSALESELAAEEALEREMQRVLDPRRVAESLQRLQQVLAEENPCLVNLELAKHIERIDCFADGKVVLRGTWLGLFEGTVDFLAGEGCSAAGPTLVEPPPHQAALESAAQDMRAPGFAKVRSRRLARRRVDGLSDQGAAGGGGDPGSADSASALDPRRFDGLADCFIWEECFLVGPAPCWSEAHASAVAAKQAEDPKHWSLVKLAAQFGVSVPTVRKALRLDAERSRRDAADNASTDDADPSNAADAA